MPNLFKPKRDGKKSNVYWGKVKLAPGSWRKVPLFSDKVASERRLKELQAEADRRAAGIDTADGDRLRLPIKELRDQYVAALDRAGGNPDHARITDCLLGKMIEAGNWQTFRDITPASIEKMLPGLAKTQSYQNKFITRAKAFVHWLLPEGWPDPLKKLKRVNEKNAKRTRERRAAKDADVAALFALGMPEERRLALALAVLNGLRRNEVQKLAWDDLHLDAPIPFFGFLRKNGSDDTRDFIPMHPYVAALLRQRTPGMPGVKVVKHVPDVDTLKKHWDQAGVVFVDERGRRLDYHALRHTFSTNLDRTGCSRATRKKIKRQANEDVTDGYAHAELSEMLAALERLPSPLNDWNAPRRAVAVAGIAGPVGDASAARDHGRDQALCLVPHGVTLTGTSRISPFQGQAQDLPVANQGVGTQLHGLSSPDLIGAGNGDNVSEMRPSTQAD